MQWLAVALGGSLGAICRFAIATYWLPPVAGRMPWATVTVNLLGSALIGFIYVLLIEEQWFNPYWRSLIMAGFLGAFTTFSTFALEALSLWQNQDHSLALQYVGLNVIGSLLCVLVGAQLAQRLV
ncbi:MAG: fluoride efflux transporter CrcB [Cellvibrionaceae bacterium]|nr:fluoride efflux transporter CrcB [Cellvibrionaceae bacterium]MCV6626947.1 fluoride efflux transporter CrcB [Cellvibrionaceae bacterium]